MIGKKECVILKESNSFPINLMIYNTLGIYYWYQLFLQLTKAVILSGNYILSSVQGITNMKHNKETILMKSNNTFPLFKPLIFDMSC